MPDQQTSDMCHIYGKWRLASARFSKLWILFVNDLIDGDLCKKIRFPFFLFLIFNHDFNMYIDFTHIAASNTASDDITK